MYYDDKQTCICLGFSEGWCKNIYDGIKRDSKTQEGKYFIAVYQDENSYWFDMKKEVFEELNKMESVDEQKKLLDAFLTEVLEAVNVYL